MEATLYGAICSLTQEGMNEGWTDGELFVKYEEDALYAFREIIDDNWEDSDEYWEYKGNVDNIPNDVVFELAGALEGWTRFETDEFNYIDINGTLSPVTIG